MTEHLRLQDTGRPKTPVRDPCFWLWFVALALATALHYGSDPLRALLLEVPLRPPPCPAERLLFLLPVAISAMSYGATAGWLTIVLSLLIMLPRVATAPHRPEGTLLEIAVMLALAVPLNWILSHRGPKWQAGEEEQRCPEQLRASEKRYRELFENASDAIWVQDSTGRLVDANAACARLTGYKLHELIGRPARRLLRQPLAAGRHELPLRRKDGSEVIVELVVTPIPGDSQVSRWQCIVRDITERQRREETIRFFARQILRVQEEERHRIARELHDSTTQTLTVLSQRLEALALEQATLPQETIQRICGMRHIVKDAIEEIRRFSQNLRPPALDALGLLASLEEMAAGAQREQSITVEVRALGQVRRLEPEVELALFRIVQEALTNARRHAHPSEVIITLWFKEDSVRAAIRDDGRGVHLPDHLSDLLTTGRMGLVGIQERAQLLGGTASIRSRPGQGTTVCVELPV